MMTPKMTDVLDESVPPQPAVAPVLAEPQEEPIASSIRYEAETDILEQICSCLSEATTARKEGYYGLAETKIEEAFILAQEVDLDLIQDEELSDRFLATLAVVAQESGRILHESSIIAEEDPMAWLEDVDIEQFRSGQWSDEELEKIVIKIALKCDVPIEFNRTVRNAIYYFQNSRRQEIEAWLKRSGRFMPLIQSILEEEGLPSDIAYLAMIESGFKTRAYSRARAAGMWQFIYATGKIYGLNRNQWVDERYDPIKATRAAARHLNDLYKITDDWNNVMAAYNSGQGRIANQLEENENIEFWDLELPRETRNYVPFYMAAVVISKAPEVFGFDNIEKDPPFEFDLVEVHPYTSLSEAAKCCGTDVATLKELNPELLTDRVPPGDESYQLRIPQNTEEIFLAEYSKIPAETYQPPQEDHVVVNRGDTFSGIADRYRVPLSQLRAANPQISNINRLSIGQRINLPWNTTRSTRQSTPVTVDRSNTSQYIVRRNDTLGIIARRFGTTYQTIQALNNMGNNTRIYPGNRLLVPDPNTPVAADNTNVTEYIVQRNDSLDIIARRFGTTYRTLQTLNNMGNRTTIYPGQKLIIRESATMARTTQQVQEQRQATPSSSETVEYTVQRNESLDIIARRFRTTYQAIQALNNMGNRTIIYPGQRLLVPASTTVASAQSLSGTQPDTASGSGGIEYVVKKNDTIYEIGQHYGVDYRKIIEYNNITNHRTIQPGDRIIIPQ
ncbi:LysM peptidoglycan-binding domain-containing protein [Candidatus Latescibacterota bacterium]